MRFQTVSKEEIIRKYLELEKENDKLKKENKIFKYKSNQNRDKLIHSNYYADIRSSDKKRSTRGKNGLKQIERDLNLKRPANLYGKPYDAYKAFLASGDKEYLELLIKYNEEDIINLKPIMEYCYNNLKKNLGF